MEKRTKIIILSIVVLSVLNGFFDVVFSGWVIAVIIIGGLIILEIKYPRNKK